MTDTTRFHLFVYGTLKSGASPGDLLRGCEMVARAEVTGTLYDIGSYPALLLAGEDRVAGEVWRCPASMLPVLDRYEGVAEGLFRRAAVRAGEWACWVYVAGPKLGPRLKPESRIASGDWQAPAPRSGGQARPGRPEQTGQERAGQDRAGREHPGREQPGQEHM